ncbi:hypothetical protein ASPACDRAFT_42969 [Aspergillus aculeatus ATCC 16872]|uniref:Uncharacterized protein n=1 Tax=Aspergillus aculeatus (strain ATCC 16872 / CBS 172.66 / WB 5094) TaxID=690307 RepID=A0A1L9WWH5_ASPA1|nr:uncharacterized protein ASPACDRAFT_42969 [Aspergillus aculeatus ATCC 16872]OJK00386.1 hypothetical protein ASPACDRAFT_42969 [Aspergillus aculeatus ATCC 16872]
MSYNNNITDGFQLASSSPSLSPPNIDLLLPLTSIMLFTTLDLPGVITNKMRACILLASGGSYLASHIHHNVHFETNNTVVVETSTVGSLEAVLWPYTPFPHVWDGVYGDVPGYGDYGRDEDEVEDEDVGADATPNSPADGSFGVRKTVWGLILCFQWVLVPFVRGIRNWAERDVDVGVHSIDEKMEEEEEEEEEKEEQKKVEEERLTDVKCETGTSLDELREYVASLRASNALADESMDHWPSTFVINKAESIKEEELAPFEFDTPDDTLFPLGLVSSLEYSDWDSLDDIRDDYRSYPSYSPDFPPSHTSETAFSTASSKLVDDCKPAADSNFNSFDSQPSCALDLLLDEYLSEPYPDLDDDTDLNLLSYSPTTSCPSPASSVSTIDTNDFLTGTIDEKLSEVWSTDPEIDDTSLPNNLTHEPASLFDEVIEELKRHIDQQQHATNEEHTTIISRAIGPNKNAQTSVSHLRLPRTPTQSTPAPPHFNIAISPGKRPNEPATPASNSTIINTLQSCLSKPHHSSKRGTRLPMLEEDSSPPSVNLEALSSLELDRLTRFNSWMNLFVNDISSPIYNHCQHNPQISGPRSMHAACSHSSSASTRTKKHRVRFHPAVTNIDIRICPRYLRTRRHHDPDGEVIERPVFSLIPLRE